MKVPPTALVGFQHSDSCVGGILGVEFVDQGAVALVDDVALNFERWDLFQDLEMVPRSESELESVLSQSRRRRPLH